MLYKLQKSYFQNQSYSCKLFFLTISICLWVSKISLMVYNLYLNCQLLKLIWKLLKIKNNILKTISILMLVNWKVFLKTGLFIFVIYQKRSYHYFKSFQLIIINFLSINVCFLDAKVKFFCKTLLYCIDVITEVD